MAREPNDLAGEWERCRDALDRGLQPIYQHLLWEAAQGDLLHNDDTYMRVQHWTTLELPRAARTAVGIHDLGFQQIQGGQQITILGLRTFPRNFPDAWRAGAGSGQGAAHEGGEGEAVYGTWMLAGFDEPYRSSPAARDVCFGPQTASETPLQRQEPGMPDTPARVLDAGREYSLDQPLAGQTRHPLASHDALFTRLGR